MPLRDEVLFLLLLDTGMRIGEACTLMVGHVRLDERVIVVGGDGKGRRERLVPIGNRLTLSSAPCRLQTLSE